MKATVNAEACIGCGLCANECPEVFEMNDENKAIVKADPVPADKEEACKATVQNCPTTAINCE